jgi:hypothetical protein
MAWLHALAPMTLSCILETSQFVPTLNFDNGDHALRFGAVSALNIA